MLFFQDRYSVLLLLIADKHDCPLLFCDTRQVGVLVYLAHVGSYLPCDCAKISVVDQILVNFGDVETCSVPQSTFQRDLTAMAGIMRKVRC